MAHLCRVCARYVVLMEAAVAVGEGHHARNTLRFFLSRWHTVAERRHKIRKVIERTECVCSFPAFCRLLRMGANSLGCVAAASRLVPSLGRYTKQQPTALLLLGHV